VTKQGLAAKRYPLCISTSKRVYAWVENFKNLPDVLIIKNVRCQKTYKISHLIFRRKKMVIRLISLSEVLVAITATIFFIFLKTIKSVFDV
jgi:hypothetical protein